MDVWENCIKSSTVLSLRFVEIRDLTEKVEFRTRQHKFNLVCHVTKTNQSENKYNVYFMRLENLRQKDGRKRRYMKFEHLILMSDSNHNF